MSDLLGLAAIPEDARELAATVAAITGEPVVGAPAALEIGKRSLTLIAGESAVGGAPGINAIALALPDLEEAVHRLAARGVDAVVGAGPIHRVAPGAPHALVPSLPRASGLRVELFQAAEAPASSAVELSEVVYASPYVDAVCTELRDLFGLEVGPEVVQPQPPEQIRFRNVYSGERPMLCIIGPTADSSPVARFLERRGESYYSVILRVPDLAAAAQRLRAAGHQLLVDGESFVHNTRVGPRAIQRAALNWVRPGVATARMLFELQQYP